MKKLILFLVIPVAVQLCWLTTQFLDSERALAEAPRLRVDAVWGGDDVLYPADVLFLWTGETPLLGKSISWDASWRELIRSAPAQEYTGEPDPDGWDDVKPLQSPESLPPFPLRPEPDTPSGPVQLLSSDAASNGCFYLHAYLRREEDGIWRLDRMESPAAGTPALGEDEIRVGAELQIDSQPYVTHEDGVAVPCFKVRVHLLFASQISPFYRAPENCEKIMSAHAERLGLPEPEYSLDLILLSRRRAKVVGVNVDGRDLLQAVREARGDSPSE